MIDTAVSTFAKGALEHAKDAAQPIAERIKEADLTELADRLPIGDRKRRRRTKDKAGGGVPWILIAFGIVGIAALVWFMKRRRSQDQWQNVTPDAFGEALDEERKAGAFGQPPIATPGA